MQVTELALGLRRRGWLVQVVSMTKPKALENELRAEGIEVVSLQMKSGIPDPRAILRLKAHLHSFRPDIVHSHLVHANILTRITRLFAHMPVLLTTAHNTNEGGKLRMLMYSLTDRLCELTTNVSHDAVESYIRKKVSPRHKIRMMPNGVNLQKYANDKGKGQLTRNELGIGNTFAWLAVGRFTEAKDYPTLLRAWEIVLRSHEGVLLLAGDGPDHGAIRELAKELKIEEHVRFLGVRKDIPQLMNAANAYVMSSLWEGMPMVLLEASASELPIVATDVGGNREVVRDGVSGYLSESANFRKLAEQMLRMMELGAEERESMGRNSREYVMRNYEMEAVISRWEDIYSEYNRTIAQATISQGG
ncbi:glycosyltransferase [Paenibacillus albus]|uniref:Glycosyltransferase n=1 Tax=Paenibacillus albus TaxID=2495582 RepID=A0A3Q8XAU0_9BACL|nr:glycosyltransferase [Paenibacillus albus]AZN43302.1 glycosyltransferase [Paenibacillus albus]